MKIIWPAGDPQRSTEIKMIDFSSLFEQFIPQAILGLIVGIWGVVNHYSYKKKRQQALFIIYARQTLFWLIFIFTGYIIFLCFTNTKINIFLRIFLLGTSLYMLMLTSSCDVLILEKGIYLMKLVPWNQIEGFSENTYGLVIHKKAKYYKEFYVLKFFHKYRREHLENLRSLWLNKNEFVEQPHAR